MTTSLVLYSLNMATDSRQQLSLEVPSATATPAACPGSGGGRNAALSGGAEDHDLATPGPPEGANSRGPSTAQYRSAACTAACTTGCAKRDDGVGNLLTRVIMRSRGYPRSPPPPPTLRGTLFPSAPTVRARNTVTIRCLSDGSASSTKQVSVWG
jgi:hypothetical protein